MTKPVDPQEEIRKDALTAFLDTKVGEGFLVETRTDTHAIIVASGRARPLLERLRKPKSPERLVISVDEHGGVTTSPAEPLRT
jgi:hypothetical protein